jgi:DNA-binding MarR family transcriptional regulator
MEDRIACSSNTKSVCDSTEIVRKQLGFAAVEFPGQGDRMDDAERLADAVHMFVRVFLVAERSGAPAEGRLKFNPLHFHFLGLLAAEGPQRSSHVAERLGVRRSTLSSAAERLVGLGLIEREPDPIDRRGVLFALTAHGRDTATAIRRQDVRNARTMLAMLPPRDRAQFLPMIERIADGLASRGISSRNPTA